MQTKENPMSAIHHLLLWVWVLTLSASALAGPQVPVLRVGPAFTRSPTLTSKLATRPVACAATVAWRTASTTPSSS